MPKTTEPLLETVPPAQTVRERIGKQLRELDLLRRLLRLAEAAERDRKEQCNA